MIVHFLSENGYGVLRLSFSADPFMEEARFNEVAYMELLNYNAKQHIFAYDRYLRFSQQQPATEDNSESQRLFRMLPDGIDLSISKVLEFADKNGFKLTKRTIQRWFAKWSSGEDRWLTITEVNGRELIYRKALARV